MIVLTSLMQWFAVACGGSKNCPEPETPKPPPTEDEVDPCGPLPEDGYITVSEWPERGEDGSLTFSREEAAKLAFTIGTLYKYARCHQ